VKTVTVDKLAFKKELTNIEQQSIKDFLFKWLRKPQEGLDRYLPLEYTETVFAKMEADPETTILINGHDQFRYATLTEHNQFIIAVLDPNKALQHKIISLDDVDA